LTVILYTALFAVSLLFLYIGSEKIVQAASKLAASLNFHRVVVGTVFVASITSMPELLSSTIAMLYGTSKMALGNIIGSNIYNIPLIVGICGLVRRFKIKENSINDECLFMIGLSVTLMLIAITIGEITWWVGLIFLLLYPVFIYNSIRKGNGGSNPTDRKPSDGLAKLMIIMLLSGLVLLCGAFLLVYSAVFICEMFNLNEFYVGFTMVAIGCVIPEVAVSIVAALHGEQEISIGNVIGDNIITMTLVLGIVGLFRPFNVSLLEVLSTVPFMILMTLMLYVMNRRSGKITKTWSLLMLALALAVFILETLNSTI